MFALILAMVTALPPEAIVPVTSQCPALHRTWDPLVQAASAASPGDAEMAAYEAARKALDACGNKLRGDEHALGLMLLEDLDASFSERVAIASGTDPAAIQCVIEVTGWKTASPQRASPNVPGRPLPR